MDKPIRKIIIKMVMLEALEANSKKEAWYRNTNPMMPPKSKKIKMLDISTFYFVEVCDKAWDTELAKVGISIGFFIQPKIPLDNNSFEPVSSG